MIENPAPERQEAPGGELGEALRAMMAAGQVNLGELAARLKVSPSYVRSLLNGSRAWSDLSAAPLRELAKIIGCPPMRVMVAAGRVSRDDFFSEPHGEIVEARFEQMVKHPRLAAYVPSRADWVQLPQDVRQCFVLMFEQAKDLPAA